jgi:hypothetical protein
MAKEHTLPACPGVNELIMVILVTGLIAACRNKR